MVTIGRLPDNVVHVDNPAVSGHHAKIYWEADHYVVEDCTSRNGTFVNGRPVTRVQLHDGDEILVCKHTLLFQDEREKPHGSEVTLLAHGRRGGGGQGLRGRGRPARRPPRPHPARLLQRSREDRGGIFRRLVPPHSTNDRPDFAFGEVL